MPIGWIDNSKSERNKVLSVMALLSERGTLDELGIAPIRDGFANLFFPGNTTIQTRAKYFLIVPYAFKSLELGSELRPDKMLEELERIEKACCLQFLENDPNGDGIIGSTSVKHMVKIESVVPMYPFSKDELVYERLIKILSLYRLTMGQARQEELLEHLFKNIDAEEQEELKEMFINLSPYYKDKL